MNDRFKFKVYHNETEKMYEVKTICFEGRPTVTLQYNPVFKAPLGSGYLMQCTGLRDKKGKLIYEGDIVNHWFGDRYITCVVRYDDLMCMFAFFDKNGARYPIHDDCEIIGNINETPELLEGDKR